MDINKPICKRCLLRDLSGREQAIKSIDEYKKKVPASEIASEELYEYRLSQCKECKYLSYGTCLKNGAYVEAFCYKEKERCPVCVF